MENIAPKTSLFKALISAQAELSNPARDKDGYGYKYTDLATLLEETKPVLKKYGLGVIQQPISNALGNYSVGVKTTLIHESGESLETEYYLPLPSTSSMTPTQAAGAAITYARRYAYGALFNIASEDDTDAAIPTKSDKFPGARTNNVRGNTTAKKNPAECDHMTTTTATSNSQKNPGREYTKCLDCGQFLGWNKDQEANPDYIEDWAGN